uniref:Uncharacterized protein n=1 Tax=Triticum urartu TaxID=4572 RepID=A0A8R7TWJ9_TRIUA
ICKNHLSCPISKQRRRTRSPAAFSRASCLPFCPPFANSGCGTCGCAPNGVERVGAPIRSWMDAGSDRGGCCRGIRVSCRSLGSPWRSAELSVACLVGPPHGCRHEGICSYV